jgi:hypothetical protein
MTLMKMYCEEVDKNMMISMMEWDDMIKMTLKMIVKYWWHNDFDEHLLWWTEVNKNMNSMMK